MNVPFLGEWGYSAESMSWVDPCYRCLPLVSEYSRSEGGTTSSLARARYFASVGLHRKSNRQRISIRPTKLTTTIDRMLRQMASLCRSASATCTCSPTDRSPSKWCYRRLVAELCRLRRFELSLYTSNPVAQRKSESRIPKSRMTVRRDAAAGQRRRPSAFGSSFRFGSRTLDFGFKVGRSRD
jgi:hypothetical protein